MKRDLSVKASLGIPNMASSTMNLQLQQTLTGKFARRQPFRHPARAPLRIVRAEDPISPDEGPVSGDMISCERPPDFWTLKRACMSDQWHPCCRLQSVGESIDVY